MAPGLTDEHFDVPLSPVKAISATNGLANGVTVNSSNGSNGKHAITDIVDDAPQAVKKGKYNTIPGPLGLASASLEGKVALVTGAGKL